MSTHSFPKIGITDPLREAAALWYDRLHREDISEETRAAFTRWQRETPEHRLAYEAVARTWELVQQVGHDPRILELRHETALRLTRKTSRWTDTRFRVAAAVMLVAIGASLMVWLQPTFDARSPIAGLIDRLPLGGQRVYSTATGERLAVTLKDGSQVTLNTQTELETAFNSTERKILLRRGQALFEVAKDPSHPFVVEAQGRRFIAVGTAFDVRVEGQRVQITMVEGTVRVEQEEAGLSKSGAAERAAAPRRPSNQLLLKAGEQLMVESDSTQRLSKADAGHITSWRSGQVIFENTRLADAIAELNRYTEAKIEIADPALADLKVSGAFVTGRTAVFIEALTTYFPIEVAHSDDRAVVLRAQRE